MLSFLKNVSWHKVVEWFTKFSSLFLILLESVDHVTQTVTKSNKKQERNPK